MKLGMIAVLAAATVAALNDVILREAPFVILREAPFVILSEAKDLRRPDRGRSLQPHARTTIARPPCAAHGQPRHTRQLEMQHIAYAGRTASDSILDALRAGGLVIVFRHSITDHSQPDAREISHTDRATQRNLTPAGVEQAKRIGESIRTLGVPVDEVHASPLFRTMDTALNAFGRAEPSNALWRTGTAEERARLLSEPPRAGTNRVLVTHNFVLIAAFQGIRPGDVAEGDAIVLRPLGDGKYEVLRRITADDWPRLASGSESDDIVPTHGVRRNDVIRL